MMGDMPRINRRMVLLAVILPLFAFAGFIALLNSLATRITPREMTVTAMGETEYRIGMYFSEHGGLPADFSVLPVRSGYMNSTTDGWGRPLIYDRTNDGFSLTSLGRDGVSGGTEEDEDVVQEYRADGTEIMLKAHSKSSQN